MNRNRLLIFPLVLSVLVLASCSGLPPGAHGGPPPPGNTALTLTLISGAQVRPGKFTILAWSANITGITLNETGGTSTNLPLSPNPFPVDFSRLSTDTAVLGAFAVPPAVSFPTMTMSFTNFTLTIHNESGGSIGNCLDLQVCEFSPAPATATFTATLSFNAGKTTNIFLTVFPDAVITANTSGVSLNFNGANTAISVQTAPRLGLPANAVDTVEDFTGVVTAVSSNSITVKSGSGIALATSLSGSVAIDDPQNLCSLTPATVAGCAPVGSIVSIDGVVNTNGSITTTEVDLLNKTTVDALEGTIFATGPGTFAMVVTDSQNTGTIPTVKAANIGDIFTVNGLNTTSNFSVDLKNLKNVTTPMVPTNLFTSSAGILNGQTVRLHVTAATGTAAVGDQTLTTDAVQLRFTRLTANSETRSGNVFHLTQAGSFFQVADGSTVQTYPGVTAFDGAADINGFGNTVAPLTSIRALFLNSSTNFYATKARHQ